MIVIFITAIILGMICQRSKFITSVQLAICTVIFSFNTKNPDYEGYLGTYNSIKEKGIYWEYFQRYDPLYKMSVRICNALGLSFNAFRLVVFVFSMLLMYNGIKTLTKRTGLVTSLYMLFPFVMDCIQLRNFIAEAVIVFSVRYLIDGNDLKTRKKNMVKYVLCVVVATMFHFVAAFYIIFIILFFDRWFNKLYKGGLIVSVLLSIALYFYQGRLASDTGYLSTNVSMATFVFLAAITICMALILKYYIKRSYRGQITLTKTAESIFRYLKVTTIYVPLIIFHYDMFRFIRNLLFVFSGFAGYYVSRVRMAQGRRGTVILTSVAVSTLLFVCYGLLLWRSAYYPYDISLVDEILGSVVIKW